MATASGIVLPPLVLLGLCTLIGVGVPLALHRWMPRERNQSSWWRPIRVHARPRDTTLGWLGHLRIDFTSDAFASAFEALNDVPIRKGAVVVGRVR